MLEGPHGISAFLCLCATNHKDQEVFSVLMERLSFQIHPPKSPNVISDNDTLTFIPDDDLGFKRDADDWVVPTPYGKSCGTKIGAYFGNGLLCPAHQIHLRPSLLLVLSSEFRVQDSKTRHHANCSSARPAKPKTKTEG